MVGCTSDEGFEDDDDPSAWIPLDPNPNDNAPLESNNGEREGEMQRGRVVYSGSLASSVESAKFSSDDFPSEQERVIMSSLQRSSQSTVRAETRSLVPVQETQENRQLLRGHLIEHPLLKVPGKFAGWLLVDLLSLEPHVRVGLMLLSIGCLLQVVALLHLLVSHKGFILLGLLFLLSYCFLCRADKKAQKLLHLLSSLDNSLVFAGLENIDSVQLRRVFFALAVFPSLLEMRTLVFLANNILDGGWIAIASAAALTHATIVYSVLSGVAPRECSLRAMACLYIIALLVVTSQMQDINRINVLAAPFILSAGSVVLNHHGGREFDWLNRSVRRALRLTLKEILFELKGNVAEDEMLQLAALRWIVDFWGSTTGKSHDSESKNVAPATSNEKLVTSSCSNTRTEISSGSAMIESEVMTTWLRSTTDQMMEEVGDNLSVSRPSHIDRQDETKLSEASGSLESLCAMLASMDVDSRAKPAVQAYKSSIERIPPRRSVALSVALIRRCPSFFSFIIWRLTGAERPMLQSFVTLLPLFLLELCRVKEWATSCATASREPSSVSQTSSSHWLPPSHVSDTIFIILCPDRYDPANPPQLLQVWSNIQSSAIALERSLLAARCVQTTCAATELTFNIMSLTRLVSDVDQKGWEYGLSVLAQDIIRYVRFGSCNHTSENTGYAAAAVSAFKSSQVIRKNISELMDDDEGNHLITCIVDVVTASFGRGWIWGIQNCETDVHSLDLCCDRDVPCHEVENEYVHTEQDSCIRSGSDREHGKFQNRCSSTKMKNEKQSEVEYNMEHRVRSTTRQVNTNEEVSGQSEQATNSFEDRFNSNSVETQPDKGSSRQLCNASSLHSSEEESNTGDDMHSDEISTRQIESNESLREQCTMSKLDSVDSSEAEQLEPNSPTSSGSDGDDWIKWAGGGLALVATVVGGIALANAGKDESNSVSNKARQQHQNEVNASFDAKNENKE